MYFISIITFTIQYDFVIFVNTEVLTEKYPRKLLSNIWICDNGCFLISITYIYMLNLFEIEQKEILWLSNGYKSHNYVIDCLLPRKIDKKSRKYCTKGEPKPKKKSFKNQSHRDTSLTLSKRCMPKQSALWGPFIGKWIFRLFKRLRKTLA